MPDERAELIHRNFPMLRISLAYACHDLQPKLLALYELLGAVEECLYHASDPVVSNTKLAWWHEELRQAKAGKCTHPLSLQLNASGALSAWSSVLLEKVFNLAEERVETKAVNNEVDFLVFCEALGLAHLELEAALRQVPVPDQRVVRQLARSNGLIQLFRESIRAHRATYYWVPLSECARLGIERQQIARNPFGEGTGRLFNDILLRVLDRGCKSLSLDFLAELPPAWSARCRHWLLLSLLQQRQLLRLQHDLAKPCASGDKSRFLQTVRLTDNWFAWQAARLLNAIGREGRE